jgi:methionyl aminopeptidase
VKIDVGIIKSGFIGDNATTVACGEIPLETKRLLAVTEQSLYEAISRARAGRKLADLCGSVAEYAEPFGFSIVREFVGHGVGRELHEEPQIPNFRSKGKTPVLQPGMILAIEPMVNQGTAAIRFLEDKWTVIAADRRMSAHYEHTVLVTDGEPELLTWRPREATPELLGIG